MDDLDNLLDELKSASYTAGASSTVSGGGDPGADAGSHMHKLDMLISDLTGDASAPAQVGADQDKSRAKPQAMAVAEGISPTSAKLATYSAGGVTLQVPAAGGGGGGGASTGTTLAGARSASANGPDLDALLGELQELSFSMPPEDGAAATVAPGASVLGDQHKEALGLHGRGTSPPPPQSPPPPARPATTAAPPTAAAAAAVVAPIPVKPKPATPAPAPAPALPAGSRIDSAPKTCAACEKPIVGPFVTALGKTWHLEHLCCSVCSKALANDTFYDNDGKLFCQKHHLQLVAPKCAYCDGPIAERCINALGKAFHAEHFFCSQCGKQFNDGGFMEHEGKAYCEEDYFNLFAPKCGQCQKPVLADTINALGKSWHPACFVCSECFTPFTTGTFFSHDNQPLCEMHYHGRKGSLCPSCAKPITGKCVNAMGKRWHPEHFACSYCKKQLGKIPYKENDDKPYCVPCYTKIYG
ncbi:hypothetical protein RI367_004048 [Sorochytrium milnesiophthora]